MDKNLDRTKASSSQTIHRALQHATANPFIFMFFGASLVNNISPLIKSCLASLCFLETEPFCYLLPISAFLGNVSDPHSFFADPDPVQNLAADPDLGCQSNADPNPGHSITKF
jgi:hypothetical protein